MKTRICSGWLTTRAAVAILLLALSAGTARAATNTYLVGSGQTYTTIQSALDAARVGGAATDTQIVRIKDSSGSYTNEELELTSSWSTRKLILEADAGQTPTLYCITLNQAIGGVTLKGLKFKSYKSPRTRNWGVGIFQQGTGTGTAPITITNCNFEQIGNADAQGWVNSIFIRASDAAGTFGKITVVTCHFDMTAAASSLDARGITMAYMDNKANVEVCDCVFLGGKFGVADDCNWASPSMVSMHVHNNLFHSQNFAGYIKNSNITNPVAYMTVENNTFVKIRDRVNGYGSGGAISLRGSVIVTGVVKDNLIVDDDANAANAGIGWLGDVVTECNADYNAFVAMTSSKVAYWNNASKTITDLNGLTSASNNQTNDTLTPANLFASYGGTNYREDYKLKAGVWALTAASDGGYVGAFGAERPTVTVTANDASANETGPDNGQFTVSRGTRTDGDLPVLYSLPASGTATPGSGVGGDYTTAPAADYAARTGVVTIANGSSNATVTVTPVDDAGSEPSETVVLLLAASAAYIVGSPSSNIVTIADNDAGNMPPVVDAGTNQTVIVNTLPTGDVSLDGTASDPDSGPVTPLTYQWSKDSGPGTVTFTGGDTSLDTTAAFGAAGVYVLKLGAYDGADWTYDTVTHTVFTNSVPVVDAGANQGITLAMTASLDGTLTADDGLPAAPVTYQWTKDGGPGSVTFGNSTNIDTTATFGMTGVYTLKLTATDGLGLWGSDTMTVTVRDVTTFTAVSNASFSAAGTWDAPGGASGPPLAGDTAVISNKTVTAQVAGDIAGGTIVNVSGSGTLTLADAGGTWSGFAVNVLAGGTWWVRQLNTIQPSVAATLSGGRLYLEGYGSPTVYGDITVAGDSTVEINSGGYSTFNPIAHGTGTLTVVGGNVDGRTVLGLAAGSTWTGDWNLAFTGIVRNVSGTQITNTFAHGLRLGAGAALSSLFGGTALLPGTWTGFGQLTGYETHTWTIGAGGTVSPGDNGPGTLKVASGGTNFNATLVFASNATYKVDIQGGTAGLYDCLAVTNGGGSLNVTGTGSVQIAQGAILDITLWTPQAETNLDAVIIDATGAISGSFSQTNWHNEAGWLNLAVTRVGNDLHVTGVSPPPGTIFRFR